MTVSLPYGRIRLSANGFGEIRNMSILRNLQRKFKFHENPTRIKDTFHEDHNI